MSAGLADSPPVADPHLSAFHRGQARLFRQRVSEASLTAGHAMKALIDASEREFTKRNGNLPKEFLPALEEKWRSLPASMGQLSLDINRTRRGITLVDTRLIPEVVANPSWPADARELAVIVVRNSYEITRRWTRTHSVTTASISLHAIGRRLSPRGSDPSDEALLADIREIAIAAVVLVQDTTPRKISVPATEGRRWHGSIAGFRETNGAQRTIVAIRTYVSDPFS